MAAIDAVDGGDDLGRLIRSLGDGRPDPAVIVAGPHLLELERGSRGLPRALRRETAVDGCLGHGIRPHDPRPLVLRLPRPHQEVPVGEPGWGHAEETASAGGKRAAAEEEGGG